MTTKYFVAIIIYTNSFYVLYNQVILLKYLIYVIFNLHHRQLLLKMAGHFDPKMIDWVDFRHLNNKKNDKIKKKNHYI